MQNQAKTQIILFLLELLLCFGTMAQKKEDAAIIQMLKQHESAFKNRETDKIKANWLHDDSVEYTTAFNFYYEHYVGWHQIDSLITEIAKRGYSDQIIKSENYKVTRQNGNLAIVDYEQFRFDSSYNLNYTIHRNVVLVKKQNLWKIASISSHNTDSYAFNALNAENSINASGYQMMGIKDYPKAIEIFKLNIKYYPNSWNTYDSLGEAYMKNGDINLSIENYEKSVAMNPKNVAGVEALERLRK